jgi:hypothetical protein
VKKVVLSCNIVELDKKGFRGVFCVEGDVKTNRSEQGCKNSFFIDFVLNFMLALIL